MSRVTCEGGVGDSPKVERVFGAASGTSTDDIVVTPAVTVSPEGGMASRDGV